MMGPRRRTRSAATRIACRPMTPQHLDALPASAGQACCLPARHHWQPKATAHAELFTMLGDLTGDRDLARLVSSAAARLQDPVMTVGPAAGGIILSATSQAAARVESLGRRRRGPGGGAPPRRPALHGAPGRRSRLRQH
jgi:hypothetical protein